MATNAYTDEALTIKRHIVLPTENAREFEQLLTYYKTEHYPGCAIERFLIQRFAEADWRLRRCTRIETHLIGSSGLEVENFYEQNEETLHRFERYANSHRRECSRLLRDFLAARRDRRLDAEAGLFTGPCFPDPETVAPPLPPRPEEPPLEQQLSEEVTAEPAPENKNNGAKPISANVPTGHASELIKLKKLHPNFNPARTYSYMSEALKVYLLNRDNLAAVQEFLAVAYLGVY